MTTTKPARICIMGTGYVGMASAIGLARLGHTVLGYDIIPERVRGLSAGVTPYNEPGIRVALQEELQRGRLTFVENLDEAVIGADFVIVAVGTPSLPDGGADLSYLDAAIKSLASWLDGAAVVLRSTVPVGTTDRVGAALRGRAQVIYAPEFLREGTALADFLSPDRIIVGVTGVSAARAYSDLFIQVDAPRVITSARNAEVIKAFSNAFLATKISFANEVANFCDRVDADALEVLAGIGLDQRIGTAFLHPGIGFGGPCFEKDLRSLRNQAAKYGSSEYILSATLAVNDRQPNRIRELLELELGSLDGRRIGIWGLAFKGNTDDVRDSLATRVVDDLVAAGAQLSAYDPGVRGPNALVRCKVVETAMDALEQVDALVVLTDWPEFAQIEEAEIARRIAGKLVVDGRNILNAKRMAAEGLQYLGIGRGSKSAASSAGLDIGVDDAIAV